mmetsp:Transcript_28865/g.80715  ORF Transcript_28865/g.80715 Transcript_28865/m.80715 type:complete len:328 (+) Transcript_28865:900-1883(+)
MNDSTSSRILLRATAASSRSSPAGRGLRRFCCRYAARLAASLTMRLRSAGEKSSVRSATVLRAASGTASSSLCTSPTNLRRMARRCLPRGYSSLTHSSILPERMRASGSVLGLSHVMMMVTRRSRAFSLIMPSILARRKRNTSPPPQATLVRCSSTSMSSKNTTEGAQASALAKVSTSCLYRNISFTRNSLPGSRWASARPMLVLPVPGGPYSSTPALGSHSEPSMPAHSKGTITCCSSWRTTFSRPGISASSTFSTFPSCTAPWASPSRLSMLPSTCEVSTAPASPRPGMHARRSSAAVSVGKARNTSEASTLEAPPKQNFSMKNV